MTLLNSIIIEGKPTDIISDDEHVSFNLSYIDNDVMHIFKVIASGYLAETAKEYLPKRTFVRVVGKLDSTDGIKIIAQHLEFRNEQASVRTTC